MQNNTNDQVETNVNFNQLHYINSIGAVIDDFLLLHTPNRLKVDIESIRKAVVYKKRSLIYNLIFLLTALSSAFIVIVYHSTKLEILLVCVLTFLLLCFAFKTKNSKYFLFITKNDRDFIELEINPHSKEDAKTIVRMVNKRVRQMKKKQ